MMVFWLIAALLIIAALLFVVPPLLRRVPAKVNIDHDRLNIEIYRDQLADLDKDLANNTIDRGYYERTYQEIERRLLQDIDLAKGDGVVLQTGLSPTNRVAAVTLGLLLPAMAVLMYQQWGAPAAITGDFPKVAATSSETAAEPTAAEHPDMGQQVEAMVAELAARMEQNPNDLEGWLMLGRSYRFLRRHAEAISAFEKALPMVEGNPQLMADYADTLAMAAGGVLEGKPIRYIQKALEIDPTNIQSLWLSGTYHFEKGEYEKAIEQWRKLKRLVPADSQDAEAMAGNVAEAELRLREQGKAVPAESTSAPLPTVATAKISGKVTLAATLLDKAGPEDTLFIFARAAEGPRMPLATLRKKVSQWPAEFSLDESMSVMPAMSLANHKAVVVGARISKSGNAMPQSGDLEGTSPVVQLGDSQLEIVIDAVVP